MSDQRIDFSAIDWESSPLGSRFKAVQSGGKNLRLVEIVRDEGDADWCRKGHVGYVIEGELEIDFAGGTVRYRQGDGISIAAGESEEHRPRPISERVLLFLVEEI